MYHRIYIPNIATALAHGRQTAVHELFTVFSRDNCGSSSSSKKKTKAVKRDWPIIKHQT